MQPRLKCVTKVLPLCGAEVVAVFWQLCACRAACQRGEAAHARIAIRLPMLAVRFYVLKTINFDVLTGMAQWRAAMPNHSISRPRAHS